MSGYYSYSAIKGRGVTFLFLLFSLWFLVMVVRLILGPILPLIEDDFLVTHAKATVLISLFAFGSSSSIFASGIFAGRIGYKRFVVTCLAAQVVVFLVIPHARTFFQLAVLIFVLGFIWGTYFPCVVPIVTSHFAPSVWNRALAIQDSGASLSAIAAPLLATLMLNFLSWRQFFYVFAAAYVPLGAAFLFMAKEVRVEQRVTVSLRNLLKGRSVWILGVLWVCASGVFWGICQVIPLYFTKELSLGIRYTNTVFGLSRIGGFACGITVGFIADRFGLKRIMFAVLCLTGLFTMFMGHSNLMVIQIAMFLQGTIITGFFAVGLMAISRTFGPEQRSMAAGLTTMMASLLGSGLLPYLLGLSGDHLSFKFGIVIFGAFVILASGLVYFLLIPSAAGDQVIHEKSVLTRPIEGDVLPFTAE